MKKIFNCAINLGLLVALFIVGLLYLIVSSPKREVALVNQASYATPVLTTIVMPTQTTLPTLEPTATPEIPATSTPLPTATLQPTAIAMQVSIPSPTQVPGITVTTTAPDNESDKILWIFIYAVIGLVCFGFVLLLHSSNWAGTIVSLAPIMGLIIRMMVSTIGIVIRMLVSTIGIVIKIMGLIIKMLFSTIGIVIKMLFFTNIKVTFFSIIGLSILGVLALIVVTVV